MLPFVLALKKEEDLPVRALRVALVECKSDAGYQDRKQLCNRQGETRVFGHPTQHD